MYNPNYIIRQLFMGEYNNKNICSADTCPPNSQLVLAKKQSVKWGHAQLLIGRWVQKEKEKEKESFTTLAIFVLLTYGERERDTAERNRHWLWWHLIQSWLFFITISSVEVVQLWKFRKGFSILFISLSSTQFNRSTSSL